MLRFLVLATCLLVTACGDDKLRKELTARTVVAELTYVRDARTGLCFGYGWAGDHKGGPVLVTVPCEVMPHE